MSEDRPPEIPKFEKFMNVLGSVVDKPASFVKEQIVDRVGTKERPVYYHRKFRRIHSIDECEVGDTACFYEANEQYKRDRRVESEILNILRRRRLECEHYYGPDAQRMCTKVREEYIDADTNWFIKYGDLGAAGNVLNAYMKQKHRMLWERRYGEVGTGMAKVAE